MLNRLFNFIERAVERSYVTCRDLAIEAYEFLDDTHTIFHEGTGFFFGKLIKAYARIFGVLIYSNPRQSVLARVCFGTIRLALGLPFVALSFFLFMAVALVGGALAGILGMRNLGDYSLKEQLAAWVLLLVLFALLPQIVSVYILYRVNLCSIFIIILIGLNFLYGQCGIVSLGHAAFVLVGGYTTTLLCNGAFGFQFPFLPAVLIAASFGGVLGYILGAPSLRIKDEYLTIVTLAFTIVIPQIIKSRYLVSFSGSSQDGIEIKPVLPPGFLPNMTQEIWAYYTITAAFFALLIFAYNIQVNSQVGRAFRIIKCDDVIARAQGINVPKYKLLAFVFSAFYASMAGGLMMMISRYISSDSYNPLQTIDYFIGLAIGGAGSILGSVIGGVFLGYEFDLMKAAAKMLPGGENLMRVAYGILLIVAICFLPDGLSGFIRRIVRGTFVPKLRRGTYYMNPPPDYDLLVAKDYRDIKQLRGETK